MNCIYNDLYTFPGYHHVASVCHLEVYQGAEYILAIGTEVPENTGTSVYNRCEIIAAQLVQLYGIDPQKLIWIDHYPPRKPVRKVEEWKLVFFTWNDGKASHPVWTRIQEADLDALKREE